ncbi:dynein heavy chain 3, axonemal-like, partial [Stegodyphus dumicola]|uniref:dynein heavy chain 3, axonemal-like n=1 Tax=Stegodyphus dumicola TaxID=202533 RepID=UPI0015AB565D
MSPRAQRNKYTVIPEQPSGESLERYWYYVKNGITNEDIPDPKFTFENLCKRSKINKEYLSAFPKKVEKLREEVKENYYTAVKQGIIDYILLDKEERERLKIERIPPKWPHMFVRSPLPWPKLVSSTKAMLQSKVLFSRPCMRKILNLWAQKYQNLDLIDISAFASSPLPHTVKIFRKSVRKQCTRAKHRMRYEWVESCVQILIRHRHIDWAHLVPKKAGTSSERIQKYFSSVCVIMSSLMRQLITDNIWKWTQLIHKYAIGNNISEMKDIVFPNFPILTICVVVKRRSIKLEMKYEKWKKEFISVIYSLLEISKDIPRPDKILLRILDSEGMNLYAIPPNDQKVEFCVNSVEKDLKYNHIGLEQYIKRYEKFKYILDGTLEEEINSFLNSDEELDVYKFPKKIKDLHAHKDFINSERSNINLNVINLNCDKMKKQLCSKIDRISQKLIKYQVEVNAGHTQKICEEFRLMQELLIRPVTNTAELVEMSDILKMATGTKMPKLMKEIKKAVKRIIFLLDHAILS